MTLDEFRADLLASVASRAETHAIGSREAFVGEVLDRLRDAGESPDTEECAERVDGHHGRKIELDAYSFDEADSSLHIFVALYSGDPAAAARITLSEARDSGFTRAQGVYEQARWLVKNIEESRPLWTLAQRIATSSAPAALRLHVLTDRPISERLKEIPSGDCGGVTVTYQIWDVTRLLRIHEAQNARDDLHIDLSMLPGGGLPVLPASRGAGDYDAYLAVVPGDFLADAFLRHGSRLLEGNVRTFLGRKGRTNQGIAATLNKEPERFFAYNNGITTTATAIETIQGANNAVLLTGITDLQIVNGAQTTASLASLRRDGKSLASVHVAMKLSVVAPDVAEDLVQEISRCANSQNAVRQSDFFANHPFHRRVEEMSRRILAPAGGTSQVQSHWYYERARGQYLNDIAACKTAKKKEQFSRMNPRHQLITKTDLAKIETSFSLLPDVACKGAEKAFVAFADRIAGDWDDELKRSLIGDDWFRAAVGRTILFRSTEALVSKAAWYESGRGYRAQIVAYTAARLAELAKSESGGGQLDYHKVWTTQQPGAVLAEQLLLIAEAMNRVLWNAPTAGQNVGEWAKQQACRNRALSQHVPVVDGFDRFLLGKGDAQSAARQQREAQRVTDDLAAQREVIALGSSFWQTLEAFARTRQLTRPDTEAALKIACSIPRRIPDGRQSARLLELRLRCEEDGFVM